METTTKRKYECHLCKKQYVRKSCFETHVVYCELMSKSKQEREQALEQELETPSMRNMYIMIQQLVRENKKMKSEITTLKKAMNLNSIKITLSEWLQGNCTPKMVFDDWFNSIVVKQEYIDFIFNENISNCLLDIFVKNLSIECSHENPVQCFSEKNNTLFISLKETDEEKLTWTPITVQTFKGYLVQLQKKLIGALIQWKEGINEDLSNINSDKNDKYMKVLQQIISINQKHENRIANFVLKNVYDQFKTNLPSNVTTKSEKP